MTTLVAAAEALNADADRWTGVSSSLADAAGDAQLLDVPASEFPSDSLSSQYSALQMKVADLLVDGKKEAREISDELVHVRTVLLGADDAAREEITQVWDYE